MAFEVTDELQVDVKNEAGALAAVLATIAKAGVEVRAFCGYGMPDGGHLMIVPADAKKATAALKKAKYKVSSSKVAVGAVKDTRGAGAAIAGKAAAKGFNLEYAYATGTGKGTGLIVLAAGKNTAKLAKAL